MIQCSWSLPGNWRQKHYGRYLEMNSSTGSQFMGICSLVAWLLTNFSCATIDRMKAKLKEWREELKKEQEFKQFYNFVFDYLKEDKKILRKRSHFLGQRFLYSDRRGFDCLVNCFQRSNSMAAVPRFRAVSSRGREEICIPRCLAATVALYENVPEQPEGLRPNV